MPMKLYVGDIIQTKKSHPCGGNQWEIMRVGMDFRIRCTTCAHQVWIPRVKLEKSIKKVISSVNDVTPLETNTNV